MRGVFSSIILSIIGTNGLSKKRDSHEAPWSAADVSLGLLIEDGGFQATITLNRFYGQLSTVDLLAAAGDPAGEADEQVDIHIPLKAPAGLLLVVYH